MKKLLLVSTLLVGLFADEIDNIINAINSKRESIIPKSVILNTKSPIPKIEVVDVNKSDKNGSKVVVKSPVEEFKLLAIINNRANINNKWLKVGDTINGYRVVDIMSDSVYLQDGNKTKLVTFSKKSKKIKIFNR